jgi:hypothetical protein
MYGFWLTLALVSSNSSDTISSWQNMHRNASEGQIKGPNTVPWGSLDRTGFVPFISPSTHTCWFLWVSQRHVLVFDCLLMIPSSIKLSTAQNLVNNYRITWHDLLNGLNNGRWLSIQQSVLYWGVALSVWVPYHRNILEVGSYEWLACTFLIILRALPDMTCWMV